MCLCCPGYTSKVHQGVPNGKVTFPGEELIMYIIDDYIMKNYRNECGPGSIFECPCSCTPNKGKSNETTTETTMETTTTAKTTTTPLPTTLKIVSIPK